MSEKIEKIKYDIALYCKNNKTQCAKAATLFVLIAVAVCLFFAGGDEEADLAVEDAGKTDTVVSENESEKAVDESIYVDVGGSVNMPGVVRLPHGSRVFEAISSAGGVKEGGDTSSLNLASVLSDGDKIYVPNAADANGSVQVNESSFFVNDATQTSSGKVNLNRATAAQLQTLSGIGPATAAKIISYRTEVGPFKTIKELMNVSGIGEKTFQKLEKSLEV